jgi:hypothetical protein
MEKTPVPSPATQEHVQNEIKGYPVEERTADNSHLRKRAAETESSSAKVQRTREESNVHTGNPRATRNRGRSGRHYEDYVKEEKIGEGTYG